MGAEVDGFGIGSPHCIALACGGIRLWKPDLSRSPCSSTHPVGGLSLRRGAERSSAEMEKNYGVISVMNVPKFAASAPGGN